VKKQEEGETEEQDMDSPLLSSSVFLPCSSVAKIPVLPSTPGGLQKTDYWRLRGKLDVPKERWISYPHCQTVSDPRWSSAGPDGTPGAGDGTVTITTPANGKAGMANGSRHCWRAFTTVCRGFHQ